MFKCDLISFSTCLSVVMVHFSSFRSILTFFLPCLVISEEFFGLFLTNQDIILLSILFYHSCVNQLI